MSPELLQAFIDELALIRQGQQGLSKEAGWKENLFQQLKAKGKSLLPHLKKKEVLIPTAALLGGLYLGRNSAKSPREESTSQYPEMYPPQSTF